MRRIVTLALSFSLSFWAVHGKAQETTDFTVKLEPYERMFQKRDTGLSLGDVRVQPSLRYEEQPSFGSALVNPGSFDDTEEAQLETFLEDYPAWSFVVGRMKRQLKKDGTDGRYDPLGAAAPKFKEQKYVFSLKYRF